MKPTSTLPLENRPVVLLMGEPTGFCLTLAELFLGNFCRVTVLTSEKEKWQQLTNHVEDKRGLEIVEYSSKQNVSNVDYGLFVYQGFYSKYRTAKSHLDFFVRNAKNFSSNALVVYPFQKENEDDLKLDQYIKDIFKNRKEYLGLVLIGEPLGPRIVLSNQRIISGAIKNALLEKKVELPGEENIFYPMSVSAGARAVLRSLLSFGGVGEISTVLSYPMTFVKFSELLLKFYPNLKFSFSEGETIGYENEVKPAFLPLDVRKAILETLEWYKSHFPKKLAEKKERKKKKINKDKVFKELDIDIKKFAPPRAIKPPAPILKWSLSFLGILAVFLVIPYFLMVVSSGFLLLAKNKIYSYSFSLANRYAQISTVTSTVSNREFVFLSKTPLVGGLFYTGVQISSLEMETSSLITEGYQLTGIVADLASHVFGDQAYNVTDYSRELSLELDDFYNKTAFLQGEMEASSALVQSLVSKGISADNLRQIRDKVLNAKKIAEELPWILGESEQRKYLFLFQNNMELRPTGGFIGSYAIVTLDKGKLSSLNVDDIYSADGQLKGHVEPPTPIKDYLGEANWFFRDSNWDPDFPTSAERAEWFLDKEVNTSVNGVVAVDLDVAKSLIDEVGPIYLSDFDKTITSKNLYETTQYEVENDFFPGSRKKSNFLTALARELLQKVTSVQKKDYINIAKSFYQSLNTKHIQLYLHDQEAQRAISNLAWDGAFYQPTCVDNCYADYMGIVEANVGVNKANYFVKRNADLKINVDESSTQSELTLDIRNEGNPSLGLSARYKDYIRVVVPQQAKFSSIDILGPNSKETKEPEINEVRGVKEAGVLVDIAAGQEKQIVFRWAVSQSLSFSSTGEYRLLWRKQAGTNEDPISIQLTFPQGVSITSPTNFSLTGGNTYRYNTNLSRDFSSRIFW